MYHTIWKESHSWNIITNLIRNILKYWEAVRLMIGSLESSDFHTSNIHIVSYHLSINSFKYIIVFYGISDFFQLATQSRKCFPFSLCIVLCSRWDVFIYVYVLFTNYFSSSLRTFLKKIMRWLQFHSLDSGLYHSWY